MTARPWRDGSGVALGLAVILVVLIGVLAAGLLAVLRSDLEATARVNGGQRALHLADAGAQAAAAQLRADADPALYDADGADNSGWAHVPPGPPPSRGTNCMRRSGSPRASPTIPTGITFWPSPKGPPARRGARSR